MFIAHSYRKYCAAYNSNNKKDLPNTKRERKANSGEFYQLEIRLLTMDLEKNQ